MSQYKIEINGLDIYKCEKMDHETMMKLMKEYKKTNDMKIKERMIYGNLKLVLSLVQKYHHRCDSMDDIFQVGMIGLIKAIDNFDVTLDLRFSTYAVPLIIGEIKRFLRENTSLRIPRSLKDISYKILLETDKCVKNNGKEPTVEELARNLNIDKKMIIEAIGSTYNVTSLSQVVSQDGENSIQLEDQIKTKKDDYKDMNKKLDLYDAMKHLDQKENLVIHQRYYEGLTQSEIAQELFISQAQVSRIEKQALERLQKYM